MIALQIADIRHFMKKLLLSESFDRFLLLEGSITTFCTFHMDGQLQKAYYTGEEQEQIDDRSLAYWEEIRPFCFELIKGKRTPLAFRFTFQLSASNTEKLLHQTGVAIPPEQIRGLLLISATMEGHSNAPPEPLSLYSPWIKPSTRPGMEWYSASSASRRFHLS